MYFKDGLGLWSGYMTQGRDMLETAAVSAINFVFPWKEGWTLLLLEGLFVSRRRV